jgi:hypothetical protein
MSRKRYVGPVDSQEVVTPLGVTEETGTFKITVSDTVEDDEGREKTVVYYENAKEPFSYRSAHNLYAALNLFMGFDLSHDKIDILKSDIFDGEKNQKAVQELLDLLNSEEKSSARARRTAQLRAQYLPMNEQSKNAAHCASVRKLSAANGVSLASMLATLQSAGLVPTDLTLAEVESYRGKR